MKRVSQPLRATDFDFRLSLSGIKGVEAAVSPPVSKECGISQTLRALCFSLSRYRLNRLPLPCSESGSPCSNQIPPRSEFKHCLPPGCFQRCRWPLVIVPQSAGLCGRARAAAATAAASSEVSAASSVSAPYSAPSRSASAAGMAAPGEATAPAAVDKPSRPIASPAVACAAGCDDRECCLISPS